MKAVNSDSLCKRETELNVNLHRAGLKWSRNHQGVKLEYEIMCDQEISCNAFR